MVQGHEQQRKVKKGDEVNEMRMLRWMCGVMKKDKIRNARGGIISGKEDLEKRLRTEE